ncbi:MAG: hypothetical protein RQ839_10680 [Thermoproteus sp.]|jgi:hypothetical protein|nr:hypothetical protein [Thermoproteus sp.]MDT7883023.1 hypothetical protein [Thermoproteus sp.]
MVVWKEVSKVCRDYMERRSGYARTNFPYYALHDVPHLENVRHIGRELYPTLGPEVLSNYYFYEAFWDCSAYVHDLGMAVGPRELDALGLHTSALRDYLKAEETSAGRGLAGKLSKFSNFFTSYGDNKNFLEWGKIQIPDKKSINPCDPVFAQFIRDIHPWISYELAKRELADSLRDVFGSKGKAEEFARYVGLVALLHWKYTRLDLPPTEFEGYSLDFRFWGAVIRLADALDATEDRGVPELGYIADVLRGDISQAAHRAFKIVKKTRDVRYWDMGVKIDEDRIVLDVGPGRDEAELLGFLLFEVGGNIYEDYDAVRKVLQQDLRIPPLWIKAGDKEESLEPYLLHLHEAHEKIENIKLTEDSPYIEELKRSGAPQELVDLLAQKRSPTPQEVCREKCEDLIDLLGVESAESWEYCIQKCEDLVKSLAEKGKNATRPQQRNPLDALAVAVLTQTPADGIVRLILRDLDSREVEKLLKALAH